MENNSIKAKMDRLARQAKQRRIALPAVKTESDAKVENKAFISMQKDIYKTIVRGG